jgi:tetratricopeptide (TPR) repeat protein
MHQRALTLATRERAMGADFGNFAMVVTANFRLGQINHSLGDYERSAAMLMQNVAALDGDLRRQTFGLAGLPSVFSRAWLALSLTEQGAFDAAQAQADEAVAIGITEDHPFSLAVAHVGSGVLQARRGRLAEAIAALEHGLVISRVADISMLLPFIAAPLGWAYALAGRHDDGLGLLREAIERAETMQLAANHAQRQVWYADALRVAGQMDAARRCALQALDTARASGERGHEAYARHLLAELAAHAGETEAVVEHASAALALAEGLGMQPLAAASRLLSPR